MHKILLADDNVSNNTILQDVISSWGDYQVLLAADGTQALSMIREEKPDLVLLDVMMPGLSGFEVCRQVKEDSAIMDIPIILVSALCEEEDRIHGFNVGANLFLSKPVSQAELKAVVERGMRRTKRVMSQEPLTSLAAFMGALIVNSDVVKTLPEQVLISEISYCDKLAKLYDIDDYICEKMRVAIKVQDWYEFLQKFSNSEVVTQEFRKLRMAGWLAPLLDEKSNKNASTDATPQKKIFVVVTAYGRLYVENGNRDKDALTALRRAALEGKYDMEVVTALENIVRGESLLQEL